MDGTGVASTRTGWSLADLQGLVEAATPEGLNFEYKQKQDALNAVLGRDDVRSIAEAVLLRQL